MSFNIATLTARAAAEPPTGTSLPDAEEVEYYSSWSLFLVCLLLILSLWTSYYLQIKRIRALHETVVSIFAGMFVGLIVRLAPGTMIKDMLTFKHTLFFNVLLPPIILNSGYELKQENFFRNFGSIILFAFLGTFISAIGVGLLVWIYSSLGLESLNLGLIECLIFGSTLSATDPVTILAIFQQYKVDPKLYTIIFGESLLNDAVSIVMYQTLSKFHGTEIRIFSIFHGIGIFLLSFSVSMALGVAFGLAMSLVLKHSSLSAFPKIESCLIPLCAYTCYFFSTGLSMSGIVSLLFCGITLKHYAYHTMSHRTQLSTKYLFGTLAQLTENFIFIYLGIALFTSAPTSTSVTTYVKPLFIAVTTISVIFTRYAAVFPLSEVINFFFKHARGQRTEEIPHSYQMMLFWAGLRGAVGVALAAGFHGENAETLRTTVLVVVVLTVLLFGGTTARMLEITGVRTGVEDEADSSDDEDGPRGQWLGRRGRFGVYYDDEPSSLPLNEGFPPSATRIGQHYSPRMYNHHHQRGASVFSTASTESFDSDGAEVLPLASTAQSSQGPNPSARQSIAGAAAALGQDGKWFQNLDERYLLPIFSNATASRTFHARRARRMATSAGNGQGSGIGASRSGSPGHSEDESETGHEIELGGPGRPRTPRSNTLDDSRTERGLPSPVMRNNSFSGGDASREARSPR